MNRFCIDIILNAWFCCMLSFASLSYIHPDSQFPVSVKVASYTAELHSTKRQRNEVSIYTDIGKAYLKDKQYDYALFYLMKAKNINHSDNLSYAPYYTAFGELFSDLGAYNTAIQYQKKILYSTRNELSLFYSASSIGLLYSRLLQPDSAIVYYGLQMKQALKMKDYIAIASSHNNLGIAYQNALMPKRAKQEYLKALKLMQENEHVHSPYFELEKYSFLNSVRENLGKCNYILNDIPAAIYNLELSRSGNNDYSYDETNLYLLRAYIAELNLEKAKSLLLILKARGRADDLTDTLYLLRMEQSYALASNNFSDLQSTTKKIEEVGRDIALQNAMLRNNMSQIMASYVLNETAVKIRNERAEKTLAVKRLKIEQDEKSVYIIISLMSVTFLLAGIFILRQFFLNKRKTISLRNEELELQSKLQELTIKMQEGHITEYALDFTKNRDFEQVILKKLQRISDGDKEMLEPEIRSLIAELKQKNIIDKRAAILMEESQSILQGFKSKLLTVHPLLSKSDIQLCYLLKLELSNKEIAMLRSVTTDSIKIFKNRLKNKLGLSSTDSLTTYLKQI